MDRRTQNWKRAMESSCCCHVNRDGFTNSSCLFVLRYLGISIALFVLFLSISGCASTRAQRQLEQVAKNWSATIRASQVIPVYPLTEDLVPGDVFLVQTPIEDQAKIYHKRGFLPLDDHMTRLKCIDYSKMYFPGYWEDDFGDVPHDRPKRISVGSTNDNNTRPKFSEAMAPRVAFPTYSFEVSISGGLALALPIKGIPIGLDFLRADRASGNITISNAITYGAEKADLYTALEKWINNPSTRKKINTTLKQTGHDHLFFRVVSRVYLTGGVVVSLRRSETTGASVSAGKAPNLSLVTAEGTINESMDRTLKALDNQSSNLTDSFAAGGNIKFASASSASVTLSESFDRFLVIGYLGFDVPVFEGGDLGAPIPTFERIEGRQLYPVQRLDVLSIEQHRFKLEKAALEAIVADGSKSEQACKIMHEVINELNSPEFEDTKKKLEEAKVLLGTSAEKQAVKEAAVKEAFKSFGYASGKYVSRAGNRGPRYEAYSNALANAYDKWIN